MNLLDLCSGGGGFHLAAEMAGMEFERVFYSDINEYANKIYKARFPKAIAVGDLRNIKRENYPQGKWIITAGFPCQPFSIAGSGLGIDDDRYLWHEVLRIADEFRPDFFIFENVAGIETVAFSKKQTRLALRRYQRTEDFDDFEAIYTRQEELQLAECCKNLENINAKFQVFDIPAIGVNAWHRRRRIWIVGSFTNGLRKRQPSELYQQSGQKQTSDSTCSSIGVCSSDSSGQRFKKRGQDGFGGFQPEKGKRLHDRSEFGDSQHDSDIVRFGLERLVGPNGEQRTEIRDEQTLRCDRAWSKHWFEIAAELCRSDDGLHNELDLARLRHDIARLYPQASEKDIDQAIQKVETDYRKSRIELLGNSIVPQVTTEFFKIFKSLIEQMQDKRKFSVIETAACEHKGRKGIKLLKRFGDEKVRLMSFAMTIEQMRNQTKTVTRRHTIRKLKAGDLILAVEKLRGVRREDRKSIAVIQVVSVRREKLEAVTQDECRREGFPDKTPMEFIQLYIKGNSISPRLPLTEIECTRIEFKFLMTL